MNIHEILQAMYDNAKPNEDGKTFTNGHVMHNLLFDGKPIVSVGADELENVLHNPELFTLAPRTHTVNSFVVPAPMDVEPEEGAKYWIPAMPVNEWTVVNMWPDESFDLLCLKRGLIHLTEAAAVANAKAMCGIDPALGVDGV